MQIETRAQDDEGERTGCRILVMRKYARWSRLPRSTAVLPVAEQSGRTFILDRYRRDPAAPTLVLEPRDGIGREPCSCCATSISGVMPTSLHRADSASLRRLAHVPDLDAGGASHEAGACKHQRSSRAAGGLAAEFGHREPRIACALETPATPKAYEVSPPCRGMHLLVASIPPHITPALGPRRMRAPSHPRARAESDHQRLGARRNERSGFGRGWGRRRARAVRLCCSRRGRRRSSRRVALRGGDEIGASERRCRNEAGRPAAPCSDAAQRFRRPRCSAATRRRLHRIPACPSLRPRSRSARTAPARLSA